MQIQNISGERQYFSFGLRGYNLDPDELMSFPYSTPGFADHVAKYVDEGTIAITIPPTAEELDPHGFNPGSDASSGSAWTPANIDGPSMLGKFSYGSMPGITSFTFPETIEYGGYDIEGPLNLVTLSWPNLTALDPDNINQGYLYISDGQALTTLNFPALLQIDRNWDIVSNNFLTSVNMPLLAAIPGTLNLSNDTALQEIEFASLATVAGTLSFSGSSSLLSALFPALTSISGQINLNSLGNLLTLNVSSLIHLDGVLSLDSCTSLTALYLTHLVDGNGTLVATGLNSLDIVDFSSLANVSGAINLQSNTLTAASFPLLETISEFNFTNSPLVSLFGLPSLVSCSADLNFVGLAGLIMFDAPNLATVDGLFTVALGDTHLTTIDLPSLTRSSGGLIISANPALNSVDLSALETVGAEGGDLDLSSNVSLATLDLSSLTGIAGNLSCAGCTSLTSIDLSVFVPNNGQNLDFTGCALGVTSVNAILARCVANAGYVSGTIHLETSAIPTGAGATNVTVLGLRGVTVLVNS